MRKFISGLSIRSKMLLFILVFTTIIFGSSIYFIINHFKKVIFKESSDLIMKYSEEYATKAQLLLDEYLHITRVMTSSFVGYEEYPKEQRRKIFMQILRDVLKSNEKLLATWTIWEPNAIDSMDSLFILKPGCTYIGSFSATFYRDKGKILLENSGIDGELFIGDYYTIPKKKKKETIMDPYAYSYTGDEKDNRIMTSIIIPIIIDNEFLGVVGIDAEMDSFKKVIEELRPFETGYAFLIANDGSYIAHPNKKLFGKNVKEIFQSADSTHGIYKILVTSVFIIISNQGKNFILLIINMEQMKNISSHILQ